MLRLKHRLFFFPPSLTFTENSPQVALAQLVGVSLVLGLIPLFAASGHAGRGFVCGLALAVGQFTYLSPHLSMVLLLAVAACLLDDNTGRIMYIVYVEVEVHRIRGRGCGG